MGAGICLGKWDLSYWNLQSLKQWKMGMRFIFSSNTLTFLIIGTGILRKIRLGNGIKTPSRALNKPFANVESVNECI